MGSGSWNSSTYASYTTSRGYSVNASTGRAVLDSVQDNFKQKTISEDLKPYKIMRECCDTEEHPNTLPVILAIDNSGSMGSAATETASALNNIMQELLAKVDDVEFCVMGIGDLAYDEFPIQMSQFESDVRIAEHLDKVYFEFGGGGNSYESYTAAWYMGAYHTKLDCWDRGKKGIIITMGDENLNPYLPGARITELTGDPTQADVETKTLYDEVKDKFEVHHIYVDHGYGRYKETSEQTFTAVIPKQNHHICKIDDIGNTIVGIISGRATDTGTTYTSEGISW